MTRVITSEADLRSIVKAPSQAVAEKDIDHIDPASRRFIEASPFVLLATTGADGSVDVSPRGDPAGGVLVLDDHTVALGDRKGNRRLDSLRNILANPHVGMLFVVPGVGDTLRVNGTARIVADAEYLPRLTQGGVTPALAVEVHVEELYIHCSKAFARSGLWDASTWPARRDVPSAGELVRSQYGIKVPAAAINAALRADARMNKY